MNLLITIIFLTIIYFLFINNIEKYDGINIIKLPSGVATGNMFSNLTCINETINGVVTRHLFKVQTSKNKDNCYTTFHRVLHPTRKLPDGKPDFLQINDVINDADLTNVSKICSSDGTFTTYITTNLRNPNSKVGRLNALGSWQEQECAISELNDTTHTCNKILTLINNDNLITASDNCDICKKTFTDKDLLNKHKAEFPQHKTKKTNPLMCSSCCNLEFGSPAKWCKDFNDTDTGVTAYINKGDTNFKSPIHNLTSQIGCQQQRLNAAGMIPQFFTDSNGKYFCLKDGGITTTDSNGKSPMCINPSNTSNTPYPAIIDNKNISCTNPGDTIINGDNFCVGNPLFDWKNNLIVNKARNNNKQCFVNGKLNTNYKIPRGQSCITNENKQAPNETWFTEKQNELEKSTKIIDGANTPWYSTFVSGPKGIMNCNSSSLPPCM